MSSLILKPFDYHVALKKHFLGRKKTWDWFKEKSNKKKQVEAFKKDLLKNSYRLEAESHPELYDSCKDICEKLSIDAQVTIYQENNSTQLNAGISILEKEAHIVLSGNIITLLNKEEMKALLAHELSHYLFYKIEEEGFEITNRIILALANDSQSENAVIESARVFQLYMELFCDAGALKVCEDYKVVIQMLVKLNTGLSDVNADSYLNQAKEILKESKESTKNDSHPESYIRSIALHLKSEDNENYLTKIKPLIEGELNLDKLDIFEQKKVEVLTRSWIQLIVKPGWMNSTLINNLCFQFFPDFVRNADDIKVKDLEKTISKSNDNIKKYLSYILLDFAKFDSDLEGAPLAHSLEIAELLGVIGVYEKIIRKELKLTVRDYKKLKIVISNDLVELTENKKDSIYND